MTAGSPSGVVTFLFTDIEGSTRRWEADAGTMRAAIDGHGGFLFKHTGDGVCAGFSSPKAAVDAAIAAQRALSCPCGSGWRPAKPSCGRAITSVRCSTVPRE